MALGNDNSQRATDRQSTQIPKLKDIRGLSVYSNINSRE